MEKYFLFTNLKTITSLNLLVNISEKFIDRKKFLKNICTAIDDLLSFIF